MKFKTLTALMFITVFFTNTTVFSQGFGICSHVAQGYDIQKNLKVIKNAEMNWVRDECYWNSVETSKGNFKIPENIKRYFRELHENGIKVLLVLNYGNEHYTLSDGSKSTIKVIPTSSETDYMQGWKQYVKTVVDTLGEYIDAYEVWNEPDGINSLVNKGDKAMAKAYVDLYVNTKELLDDIEPEKPVLFGALFSGGNDPTTIAFYDELKSVAESNNKTFNEMVSDISFHFYVNNRSVMNSHFYNQEQRLLKYGFTGNIWFTETGLSETKDSSSDADVPHTQAEYLPIAALEWDRYVKDSKRNGVGFWYDLRNDGTNSKNSEHNYGLVDYNYNEKNAFKAMQARNKAVNYMPLTNYEKPETYSGLLGLIKCYGILGTYSDGVNTTYVGYHEDEKDGSVEVKLTGEKAYVYDCLGNLIETITDTLDTYKMPIEKSVTYVVCVNPRTYVNFINYDKTHNLVSVKGELSELEADNIEISLYDTNKNNVYSETVAVKDGKFETEFTFSKSGTYTLTAGADITKYYGSETFIIEEKNKSILLGDSLVVVSENKITVSGVIDGEVDGETVSVLVVPAATDLKNLKAENIAYIDDIEIKNGAYSLTFTMPQKSEGIYNILLSGADFLNSDIKKSVIYGIASGYINVCDFEYNLDNNIILVTARVKNPLPTSKSCEILVIQYNDKGAMVDISVTPVSVEANVVQVTEKTAKVKKASGAVTAKAYIWDSFGTMYPIAEGLPIPLN